MSKIMRSYKHAQDIANIQLDINRAIWAMNIYSKSDAPLSNIQNEKDRDEYIERCLRSAQETLNKILNDE